MSTRVRDRGRLRSLTTALTLPVGFLAVGVLLVMLVTVIAGVGASFDHGWLDEGGVGD